MAAAPGLHCLNCDGAFGRDDRFCPHCGQRTDTVRLTVADVARDLLQTFAHVERGPLAFAWALLTRPGGVAREYVAGRRRRHYGPFTTLAVLVGLTALALNWTGFQALARDGLPRGPADLLQHHFNLLLLVQLPMLGAVCALVFRSAHLTWPEHMVLAAYTLSVRAVVVAVLAPLAMVASRSEPTMANLVAFWAAWYAYFGWAASQFYAGNRWLSGLLGGVAAAVEHAVAIGAIIAASAAYDALVPR